MLPAHLIALIRPVWLARELLVFLRSLLARIDMLDGERSSVFKILDFHLLSKASPREALSILEAQFPSTPEPSLVCADYAIAGQLCERLFEGDKALKYYRLAYETAPEESVEFRASMISRIQMINQRTE